MNNWTGLTFKVNGITNTISYINIAKETTADELVSSFIEMYPKLISMADYQRLEQEGGLDGYVGKHVELSDTDGNTFYFNTID